MYVILHTDNPDLPAGYGLTFTLGRGNEIVAAMCASPQHTPSYASSSNLARFGRAGLTVSRLL